MEPRLTRSQQTGMWKRLGTGSFNTVKQQGEVLTITLASEEDLEPVQDSIQFTEQEWKGE